MELSNNMPPLIEDEEDWGKFYAIRIERHANRFLQLAQTHRELNPQNLALLDIEYLNLLQAMENAFDNQRWQAVVEFARSFCSPISGYLGVRGYWQQALKQLQQAAQASSALEDWGQATLFAVAIGWVFYQQGKYAAAQEVCEGLLRDCEQWEPQEDSILRVRAVLHEQLGLIAQEKGDLAAARQHFNHSLSLKGAITGLPPGSVGAIFHQLGSLFLQEGNLFEAKRHYEDSLLHKSDDPLLSQARTLHQLGEVSRSAGKYLEAQEYYERSLVIKETFGDRMGMGKTYHSLGLLAYQKGDLQKAQTYLYKSLDFKRGNNNQPDDLPGLAKTFYSLGQLSFVLGQYNSAEDWLNQCLAIEEALDIQQDIVLTLGLQCTVAKELGDLKQARSYAIRSCHLAMQLNDQIAVAAGQSQLAELDRLEGNWEAAEEHSRLAIQICQETGNLHFMALEMYNLASLYESQRRLKEAAILLRQVIEIGRELFVNEMVNRPAPTVPLGLFSRYHLLPKDAIKELIFRTVELLERVENPDPQGIVEWLKFLAKNWRHLLN